MDRLLIHLDPRNARLALHGELDAVNVAKLSDALTDLIEQGHRHLQLDLSEVTWCDQAGLDAILGYGHALRASNRSLTLSAASPAVHRMLEHAGLPLRLPITALGENRNGK
ncbi:STAS domain-containing protein [Phaeacidiphilus oryzae]|jgi:anti-anti-sigma factor|uniref:STAS domain-containing protein n=1 Tax=Phaeacidiphilus oryzae TaxID=348818 RepID=UPI00056A356F|nr:STAS domain-containing protein [Phaeacidiphilus oryzae]